MSQTFKTFFQTPEGIHHLNYVPENVITGDTDSVYLDLSKRFTKDSPAADVIQFADALGKKVNEQIPDYARKLFHCSQEQSTVISTEREVVSYGSFFVAKKNYLMVLEDKGGVNKHGELKVMGLAVRKSDTPKVVQDFLKDLILYMIADKSWSFLKDYIEQFRLNYRHMNLTDVGRPMAIHNLTKYTEVYKKNKGSFKGIPYHMRAAINWNEMCQKPSEPRVQSGSRVKIVYLQSVSDDEPNYIAVPADVEPERLPVWLKDVRVDWEKQWETVQTKLDAYLIAASLDPESRRRQSLSNVIEF